MRKLLLLSLLLIPAGLCAETPTMPSEKEQKALVLRTLLAFNQAVQEKSFADFRREHLSPRFRAQYSLEKFTDTFQGFIDGEYDISGIAQAEIAFDVTPEIDDDGVLLLEGHYPTRPSKVSFRLRYVYGASGWKLLGINVRVIPVESSEKKDTTEKKIEQKEPKKSKGLRPPE